MPVLAVLPWDLYLGLLQTLANLPEEFASTQLEGVRALLADSDAISPADPSAGASSAPIRRRPPHRRRHNR
jgi:hypothetical protein